MMHMLLKISKDIYLYFTFYCDHSNYKLTTINMIEIARKLFRSDILFYFREPQNRAWHLFRFQPSA